MIENVLVKGLREQGLSSYCINHEKREADKYK